MKEELLKELLYFSPSENDSIKSIREKFYDIVRRYGIKRGEKIDGGGIAMNLPSWEVAESIFLSSVSGQIKLLFIFAETPEDLIC